MPENESRYTKEKLIKKEIFSWIRVIVLAVVIAIVINSFVIINAKVDSGSMENTMMTDSRAFGLRFSYWFSEPERYDIIVFKYPDDETQKFVKRVIGLPGETVNIVEGVVSVTKTDGTIEVLDDSFVRETPIGSYGPYTVPENSYFVMGDNRNDSHDSRMWIHTFVTDDEILGKVVLSYWPKIKVVE